MKLKILTWTIIVLFILLINIFFLLNCLYLINSNFDYKWEFNIINLLNKIFLDKNLTIGIIILTLIFILFIIKYTYNTKLNRKNKYDIPINVGSNEYGSARWATPKEIFNNFNYWKPNNKLDKGGIIVTYQNNKFYYDVSTNHSLIIGSTGSGKTVSCIMPLIFNLADASESMVINDSKGELLRKTYSYLKDKEYNIKIINLRDPLQSDGWNPLYLPYKYYKEGNIEKEVELINDFSYSICQEVSARDPYWSESSTSVLAGLCLGLIEDSNNEKEVHFNSIYNLLVEHGTKTLSNRKNSLDEYFDNKPFGNLSKNYYATGGFAKGETRATIFSVLSSKLRIFSDIAIANMTSQTDFELENIGKEKTAVFLIIPDEKEARHILASLFVDQCYQSLVKVAQEQENGQLPIRVNFVLDEFANMPPIKSFSNKITVSRGRNIRFYLIIQDFDQLKEKYRDQTGTIKSNCNNWIYLLTADNDTAREISNRLGKYTIESERVSSSNRLNSTEFNISNDKSLIGRELLTPDELMKFKFGEAIFLQTRMNPIKCNLPIIDKYPIIINNMDLAIENKKIEQLVLFDLDKYRESQSLNSFIEQEIITNIKFDPTNNIQ